MSAFEAGGDIYIMEVGGTPTKIVSSKAGVVNMQPVLSPDASRVAFSSKRDDKFSIYVVGVDEHGRRG
jgi:Tol biopolymer transport system component